MNKYCENCGNCFIDFSVGLYECQNMDNMTEQEIEEHYTNNDGNCPYWKLCVDNDQNM